jgi:hypothetical protein
MGWELAAGGGGGGGGGAAGDSLGGGVSGELGAVGGVTGELGEPDERGWLAGESGAHAAGDAGRVLAGMVGRSRTDETGVCCVLARSSRKSRESVGWADCVWANEKVCSSKTT